METIKSNFIAVLLRCGMTYIKTIYFNDRKEYNPGYESEIPVIRQLIQGKQLELPANVNFFVGENGSGKSTLLEGIAVSYGFNPEGGSINFNFSTKDTHSDLSEYLILAKSPYRAKDGFFYRAESFYNVSTNLDEIEAETSLYESYGGRSLHAQSHGEGLISLIQNRFGGNGLYILDEPEAALSPSRQLTLLCLINELVKRNSQFIIATHSPILMAYPDAAIYEFCESGFEKVRLEETEHYSITKAFVNNPEGMMKYLFSEEDE